MTIGTKGRKANDDLSRGWKVFTDIFHYCKVKAEEEKKI